MTSIQILLFVAFALSSVVTNVLWYQAKSLLGRHGFPVSLFVRHFQDLEHLSILASGEIDPTLRVSYHRLRSRIIGSLIATLLFFGGFIALGIYRISFH